MPEKNNLSALKTNNVQSVLPNPGASDNAPRRRTTAAQKVTRHNKGFQVEAERAGKWDLLVAQMKNKPGNERKTGPQLIDEAMDYILKKYAQD